MKESKWFTYENGLLLLLGFIFGIVFFDRNAVSVLTPYIVQDLDLSNTQLGMLSSGLALAWALSAYFIGSWSDRSGKRKPFLLIAIVVFSLCSVVSGVAGSFLFLLLARVVMGLAEGPFLPICFSIMNVESSPKRRGVNAGLLQTFFASLLGTTLAPIVLVALAEQFDWRITFFLTGIPGLICALLVWKFMREPKSEAEVGTESGSAESTVVEQSEKVGALQMLKDHNIRICSLVACCLVGWFVIGLTFLPVFLTSYRGFEPTEMAGLMAVTGLCTMCCGFLVPALSDKFGRKPILIIFSFLGLITPFTALYFDGPLWVMAVLLFLGWSGSGAFPLFMGVIPGESVSRKYAATAMGLIVCVGELVGGVGGPVLAGWVADKTSLVAPMIGVGLCAGGAGFASLFLKETAPNKVSIQAESLVT